MMWPWAGRLWESCSFTAGLLETWALQRIQASSRGRAKPRHSRAPGHSWCEVQTPRAPGPPFSQCVVGRDVGTVPQGALTFWVQARKGDFLAGPRWLRELVERVRMEVGEGRSQASEHQGEEPGQSASLWAPWAWCSVSILKRRPPSLTLQISGWAGLTYPGERRQPLHRKADCC